MILGEVKERLVSGQEQEGWEREEECNEEVWKERGMKGDWKKEVQR